MTDHNPIRSNRARAELNQRIKDEFGSRMAAAKALGIPYPTLSHVCSGGRGMSPRMARKLRGHERMQIPMSRLLGIRAIQGKRRAGQ